MLNNLNGKGPPGSVRAAPAPGQSHHGCGHVGVRAEVGFPQRQRRSESKGCAES